MKLTSYFPDPFETEDFYFNIPHKIRKEKRECSEKAIHKLTSKHIQKGEELCTLAKVQEALIIKGVCGDNCHYLRNDFTERLEVNLAATDFILKIPLFPKQNPQRGITLTVDNAELHKNIDSYATPESVADFILEQLQLLIECRDRLTAMITFQKKLNEMEKIYIDSLPAIIVASHRAEIPSYDDLGKLCYMTIGPEMSRLGCECPEPGYCYTIEHGGYRQENIDIEYCEQVAAMGKDSDIINFKQIPEAAEAVCMKVYGPYGRLNENLREVLEWIASNGYVITSPPRYSYVDGIWNQEDPEKWLTVIQVPVEKA